MIQSINTGVIPNVRIKSISNSPCRAYATFLLLLTVQHARSVQRDTAWLLQYGKYYEFSMFRNPFGARGCAPTAATQLGASLRHQFAHKSLHLRVTLSTRTDSNKISGIYFSRTKRHVILLDSKAREGGRERDWVRETPEQMSEVNWSADSSEIYMRWEISYACPITCIPYSSKYWEKLALNLY